MWRIPCDIKKQKYIHMKRIVLLSIIATSVASLTIVSCKKEDKTAPVITLTGAAAIDHILNSAYTDQGATATDDKDGDLTASITVSGTVNKDLAGNYTLTYNATDAAGNAATPVTRVVTVNNQANYLAGTYSSTLEMPWPGGIVTNPTRSITASSTVNKSIIISGLGESTTSNVTLIVDMAQDTLSVPQQTGLGGYSFGPYVGLPFPSDIGTGNPIVINLYAKQTLGTNNKNFKEILSKQ